MPSAALDAAFAALCVATIAAELLGHSGAGTTACTHAPQLGGAVQVFPLLAATAALFTAVAFVYHRLRHAGAGAGSDRRLSESELVTFVLCACAGFVEFLFFVQPAGVVADGGALRVAAVQALPAAASVTFFLAMTLIFVHVGAGGGRDDDGAAAGEGLIQVAEKLLTKMTLGAAAALVILMALAF